MNQIDQLKSKLDALNIQFNSLLKQVEPHPGTGYIDFAVIEKLDAVEAEIGKIELQLAGEFNS